jgi:hypothetical protein
VNGLEAAEVVRRLERVAAAVVVKDRRPVPADVVSKLAADALDVIAHLRRGGSIPPPATPRPVPVHTLRYHDCSEEEAVYRHFWLECSIDGGPWHRVRQDGVDETPCPCPGAGVVVAGP